MKKDLKKTILEYVKVIGITVVITYGILYFIQISKVVGDSMEPNYHDGNIILVDKVFYKQNTPSYNDIVVVNYEEEDEQIIKRVIGVGGDHIEIKDNVLYRNGKEVNEDYILEKMVNEDFSIDVPEGQVFVMGDNRNISLDSRIIGCVDFDDDVVGKVFFKVF